MVNVRYFAGLREQLGRSADEVCAAQCATVLAVWQQATGRDAIPDNLLCAVNLEYVAVTHSVVDGDEVAFFPPVTGG